MFNPRKFRRAQAEDVRKVLFAAPERAWSPPEGALEGVSFELHSHFELDSLYRALPAQFRDAGDVLPRQLERRARVHYAGGFSRTTELIGRKPAPAAVFALENPQLGAVYVDVADKSYLHFSPSQLPQADLPASLMKDAPRWEVTEEQDTLTLSARGPVSLDVVIEYSRRDRVAPEIAAAVLSACLPGLKGLVELGLPLKRMETAGMPQTVHTWLVNDTGRRIARLAHHRISDVKTGKMDPALFRVPEGFRDLRHHKPKGDGAWHPIGGPRRRARRGKAARSGQAHAAQSAQARAAYSAAPYQATLGTLLPPKIEVSTEPALPGCLPSTPHASSALEIRQSLLDAIRFMVNLMANRLDTATGTRPAPADPDNTDVELTVEWLAQLEQFHQSRGDFGDGLFCLLRDVPPEDDPLGGGTGLLDRLAESLAREFVAEEEPIPLGGEDDPVALPQAIEDEIAALAQDDSIPAGERFDGLAATSRAAVREAVLAQRIATIALPFDGNFGEQQWPNRDFDLVHIKLQLEQLAVEFSDEDTIRQLLITLDDADANQPRIDFEVGLERLEATLTMERWPGSWFWWTAAGVLAALAIVGPVAVTGLILTLVGLGPLGLLILMLLLAEAPVATVAGGALILAVVTYLVWDVTRIRLLMEQPVLRSSVSPDRRHNPDEVLLDPDRVSLDGNITVSVNSEIPSGIHQIFDAVVNFAITQFDVNVREAIESAAVDGLEHAVRRLPHFRLPQPFDVAVPVALTGAPVDQVDVAAPQHELVGMSANGVAERFLSAGALTRMKFPFPGLAPQLTQVDLDLREKLTARMEQVSANGMTPRLGYGISQNLLNGIVFSQWLAGRFVRGYNDDQIEEAFATLGAACPDCADISEREVRVWAAAPPQVFVTPRAYLEEEARPYLSVLFPDVRICMSGAAGKRSTLEIQFSVQSIAHVAFGGLNNGSTRTFFSVEGDYLNVLFDDRREFRRLSPVGTQGFETDGPGYEAIGGMDAAQRLELLQNLQPLLDAAAARLLRRNDVRQISFVPGSTRFDQQVYDGVVLADIQPRRTSLYAVITTFGPITTLLPRRDENDDPVAPLIDLDGLPCEQGANLRGDAGS